MASESLEIYIAAFSIFIAPILVFICLRLIRNVKFSNQNQKNIVLVGCDTDCGKILLRQLVKSCGHVFATYKDKDKISDLLAESWTKVTFISLDPRKTDEIDRTIKLVTSAQLESINIWAVINLTGNGVCNAKAEWCPKEIYKNAADDNLWAPVEVIRRFLPLIKESRGRMIQLGCSSVTAMSRKAVPYCVANASLRGFIETLCTEMKRYSVTIHWIELQSCYEHYTLPDNEDCFHDSKRKFWNEISTRVNVNFDQLSYDACKSSG